MVSLLQEEELEKHTEWIRVMTQTASLTYCLKSIRQTLSVIPGLSLLTAADRVCVCFPRHYRLCVPVL